MLRFPAAFVLLLAATVVLSGCSTGINQVDGSGVIVTEEREIEPFTKIELRGEGLLLLERADAVSLEINTDDNLLEHISSTVRDGTLILETERNIDPSIDVRYSVGFERLEGIEVSGSGDVRCGSIEAEVLTIGISGSGDMNLGLDVRRLIVDVSGSGDFYLNGKAEEQEIVISGSGDYRAEELTGAAAAVEIRGSGKAQLNVSENLDVSISGSGAVSYRGSPAVNQSVSGSGSIQQIGD